MNHCNVFKLSGGAATKRLKANKDITWSGVNGEEDFICRDSGDLFVDGQNIGIGVGVGVGVGKDSNINGY